MRNALKAAVDDPAIDEISTDDLLGGLMPVRKHRSIDEMPDETWREPGDPLLYRAVRKIWDFGRRTSRRRYRPGVYRFRSIEAMDVAQADWDRATAPAPTDPIDVGLAFSAPRTS